MRRQSGMTLLEIMVAIMIVGVLLSVALPRLSPHRGQLRTSARNLAALIRYARTQAIYGHRSVQLLLDVRSAQYRLDLLIDSVPARKRRGKDVDQMESLRTLPDRVYFDRVLLYDGAGSVKSDVVQLDFSPRGTVTPATVVLADTKGHHMTLDIFGTTGAVEVYRGEPPADGAVEGES